MIRLGTTLPGPHGGAERAVVLPPASLAGHALICGTAGSGKTATARELLRQLWAEHAVPFLVIAPVSADTDDYRKLAAEPGFEALEVITVGDEGGRPLRFNPFEVPPGALVGAHITNLLACFTAAFGLFEPLRSGYRDALNLTYLRNGILLAERPDGAKRTWPTVAEFLAAVREVTNSAEGGGFPGGLRGAAIRPAEQLVRGIAASAFLTDRPNDVGRLVDHPVILELTALGPGDEQALMMALLLNAVAGYFQPERGAERGARAERDAGAELRHVTVVEEAHRLLGSAPGGNSPGGLAAGFAGILAENRKDGAGVILIEQAPGKLTPDAVKNVNLKIVHRLTAADDLRYLGETMGMDERQRGRASRLRAGEALLYGAEFAEAVQVSISRTPGAPGALGTLGTPETQAAPSDVVVPAAAPPFAACDRCRAQCEYRGGALSMLNDPQIVAGIGRATDAVDQPGRSPGEQQSDLAELAGLLFRTVGKFAALPSAAPGRSDAAYCLLLHALASGGQRAGAQWPETAARLLGIAPGSTAGSDGTQDPLGDR